MCVCSTARGNGGLQTRGFFILDIFFNIGFFFGNGGLQTRGFFHIRIFFVCVCVQHCTWQWRAFRSSLMRTMRIESFVTYVV